MSDDAWTAPERFTERELAKRVRSQMTNVCAHCIHRVTEWGLCPHEGRQFPACVETPGVRFELDERTIRGL